MKQNVNIWMIVGAVAVLALVVFGIFKLTSGNSGTAGYTAPPSGATAAAEGQRRSEEYGKQMMERMKANGGKMNGGGAPAGAPGGGAPH